MPDLAAADASREEMSAARAIHFGTFNVSRQVFHLTPLSYALVNLKPLLPGHVLVCPLRCVARYTDLTPQEIADLAKAVQRVGRCVERVYKASALNIAIQDGTAAGQSVPHVHTHIIPRHESDLDHKGGTDAIYDMLDGEENHLGNQYSEQERLKDKVRPDVGDERAARSMEEMEAEARMLEKEMKADEEASAA